MSYAFRIDEPVSANVRRIGQERLTDAADALTAALDGEDVHDNVHTARKRNKHVRALVRLVRKDAPALHARENVAVRDAARLLSPLRDATAVIETLDLLSSDGDDAGRDAIDDVRARLHDRRAAHFDDLDTEDRLRRSRDAFAAAAARAPRWEVGDGFDAMAGGLAKTYRRARNRLADLHERPTTTGLHQLRKRVKYHRYHVRLLRHAWHPVLKARRGELHRLSDLLGDDHDLAVLRGVLAGHDDDATQTVVALTDRRRARLQQAVPPLARRLFDEPPDAFVARVAIYWAAWHDEADLEPTAAAAALEPAEP